MSRSFQRIMFRRLSVLSVLACAALGCASEKGAGTTAPPEPERAPRPVPERPLPQITAFETETPFFVAPTEVRMMWNTDAPTVSISPTPDRVVDRTERTPATAFVTVTATTTFTLTATNENGSTTRSLTVTVVPGVATNLPVNDVLCDTTRGKLLASIPSGDRTYGNTIVVVDPTTGAVERSTAIGSEPKRIALSDDGSTLWVGIDGAHSIRKLDTRTNATGPLVQLPAESYLGPTVANEIVVLEGSATAVAVSYAVRDHSPSHVGVAVYDDGIVRPKVLLGAESGSPLIARGATATDLFGYDNEISSFAIRRLTVDAAGVSLGSKTNKGAGTFATHFIHVGGRLFFGTGEVLDGTSLAPLGTYKLDYGSAIFPDLATDTVYRGSTLGSIRAYAADTFTTRGAWSASRISISEIVGCGESLGLIGNQRLYTIPKSAIR